MKLADFPLSYSYSKVFKISLNAARLIALPALFASILSSLHIAGRILKTMAESKLLFASFGWSNLPIVGPYYCSFNNFHDFCFNFNLF
jgi:hypothetical protein